MDSDPATDEQFMRRALRLAMNGRGRVEPNPMVGCVIVKNAQVIGEGYHEQYGGPHAEPNALANCKASAEGATAYVTLEPCCHTNKKTPPCAPRLIEAKLARVVIGCLDPNPEVNGQGVAMIRAAGVQIHGPVLEQSARQLIAPFFKRRTNLPYVTLKWAQTADGKVAGPSSTRLQISNAASTRLVHQLRARSDGIMVGINTVLTDDPLLNARDVEHARPLVRFVLDSKLLIPEHSRLVTTANEIPLVVACRNSALDAKPAKAELLTEHGVTFVTWPDAGEPGIPLDEFMSTMFQADTLEDIHLEPFTHLLVEPGPTLAESFFRADLCDRLWVFQSTRPIDDPSAPSAAPVPAHFVQTGHLDLAGDTLTEYLNPNTPVFFAPEPSADFVLAL
jgi:diaminohydroxyphosphoribosylaminopyrimidine deaminase/5-amino-6-(5-phosphoribosylamino)uracil reductase